MSREIADITARRALLSPDNLAMEELVGGQRVTYRGLEDRAARAATVLADEGVRMGDRVAILCRNRIEFFELLFACAKLGAILVPLNWRMPAAELRPLLADCAPSLLLHGAEDARTVRELFWPGLVTLDLDTGYVQRRNMASLHPGRGGWPADDIWYLLYTSGTTGTPKAVIYTYAMAFVNYVNISQPIGLSGRDRTLNFLPLFHTAGINLHTLPTLMAGGQVLVLPGFDADVMIGLLAEGRLDHFFGVPAVYLQLSQHPRFDQVDLSRVRHWGCGGAPLPDVLVRRYAERGARVCNGMGMTETGPTAFLGDPDHALEKIGSVGKPQIMVGVRIVDPLGRDVPPGQTGELLFGGLGVTPGYWRQPAANQAAFTEDGWLRSGDIARCDADGYYYIVGRLKEMFISGGENVYPAEVENVLTQHEAVLEAAVIGVPDPQWGEVGRAFVRLKPGHPAPQAEELARFCRDRLAGFKVPRQFLMVPEFPRTAAGKVQKHKLDRQQVTP